MLKKLETVWIDDLVDKECSTEKKKTKIEKKFLGEGKNELRRAKLTFVDRFVSVRRAKIDKFDRNLDFGRIFHTNNKSND